jgi:hypothetical protein
MLVEQLVEVGYEATLGFELLEAGASGVVRVGAPQAGERNRARA